MLKLWLGSVCIRVNQSVVLIKNFFLHFFLIDLHVWFDSWKLLIILASQKMLQLKCKSEGFK